MRAYLEGNDRMRVGMQLHSASVTKALNFATNLISAGIEVFHESRPGTCIGPIFKYLMQYVPQLDAFIPLDYLYCMDGNWDINSHTFSLLVSAH